MNVVNVTITTRLKFTRKYGITSDSLSPYDNTISMSDAGQAGQAGLMPAGDFMVAASHELGLK